MYYRRYTTPSIWDELNRMQREMRTMAVPSFPAINVWSGEEGAVVTAEIPGVSSEDLDISVVGETLTIKGERKSPELAEGEHYHRQERTHGYFTRTIELPFPVNADDVTADLRNGVLSISLPRAESDKPRKISVQSLVR